MKSNKQRIGIDYAPLNVAVSVECLTPASSAMQVYNSATGEYDPDRAASPSQFWPQVNANASDGSWDNQYANSVLAQMRWYVNGTLISEHPDFQGTTGDGAALYSIDESSSNYRGALTIRKNVPPGQPYSLQFKAVVADPRLGTNIQIATETFLLSTQDKSEDSYSIGIGDDQIIQYNPFKDKLHLYEYKVAHGLIAASDSAKAAATDENSYIRAIPVAVYKAGTKLTSGFSLELYRVDGASKFTKMTAADPEVVSVSASGVSLDLRLIAKADFLVKAVLEGNKGPAPQIQFSVGRIYPDYKISPTNGASILPMDVMRFDKAMVQSDGNVVDCPESIIRIVWKTDSAYLTGLEHNEGGKTLFELDKTMIGRSYGDDWLEIYTESEIKEAHKVAVSGGDTLVDGNGNILIIN